MKPLVRSMLRALAFLSFLTVSAHAATAPAELCDRAAAAASQATGVPIDILLAIARVETGRKTDGLLRPWPWTINADGKGTFYDTKAQAVAAAEAHQTDGTITFDIGCFQLNIRWHGEAFSTFEDMFDPDQNALYAAHFLNALHAQAGNWSDAVAAYHSRTPDLAQAYLDRVKSVLETPDAAPEPLPVTRPNTFPLLQAGAQGALGSVVPVTDARAPLIGG